MHTIAGMLALGATGSTTANGVSISGGSVPAYLVGATASHSLNSLGIFTETTTVATVSGGTLGYAAVTSTNLAYPSLSNAPYDINELNAWTSDTDAIDFSIPGLALDFNGLAACVTWLVENSGEHVPNSPCQQYEGVPTVLPCLREAIRPTAQRPIWYCALEYLVGSADISMDKVSAGPRPWQVVYSVLDQSQVPFTTAGRPQPLPGMLSTSLSLTSMNVQEGKPTTFTDSPNFESNGRRGLVLPLAIELPDALAYSSSFLTMNTMYKGADDTRCTLGLPPAVEALLQAGYRVHGTRGRGAFHTGLTTDGGSTDGMGIVPLLRTKRRSILAFYASPSDPADHGLANLFGVNASNVAPFSCAASSSTTLLGTNRQVFPASAWKQTIQSMNAVNNTGVTFLRNLPVLANPALGVEAYTLDALMIVDNQRKSAFEAEVLTGADAVHELVQLGYPRGVPTGGSEMVVAKPVAVAMSLLTQWKLAKNLDEIKAAFAA